MNIKKVLIESENNIPILDKEREKTDMKSQSSEKIKA